MKFYTVFLLAVLLNCSLSGSGKYGGEFMSGSTEARSLSLGGMILTSFETPAAVYFNPSYLPEMKNSGILLSHSERFDGAVRQEFAAFNTRYSGVDAGLALIWINVDGIVLTRLENENDPVGPDNRILPDRTVSDNEFAFFISAGKKYNDRINMGASVKLLYKSLDIESAFGTGFDLSGYYKISDNISAGAKISDITTSALFWTTGKNEIIRPSINIGAEYNNRIEYFLADYKLIGGTLIRSENYSENAFLSGGIFDAVISGGIEVAFNSVMIRGGYNTDNTWSAGAGVSFLSFILDYSFRPDFEDLGNTHKASISYIWK